MLNTKYAFVRNKRKGGREGERKRERKRERERERERRVIMMMIMIEEAARSLLARYIMMKSFFMSTDWWP